MFDGMLAPSWWGLILIALSLTHITIATVTIFLHRAQAHRALELKPAISHFFRFWNWLTTGMVTAEWVAVHRRHHARCETEDDPHSPQILGLPKVLWEGAELYSQAAKDPQLVERYSKGAPDDWIERNLYTQYRWHGVALMLLIDFALFGVAGVAVWAIQMAWIPFFAAGVINGIGHYWGYRNFEAPDASTNLLPWGILIGGEELHNNHHAFPSSAKLSAQKWEFDIGWFYIRVLEFLGQAKVRRVAREPLMRPNAEPVDLNTVKALVNHRMHVLARFSKQVVKPTVEKELCSVKSGKSRIKCNVQNLLTQAEHKLDSLNRARLAQILAEHEKLKTIHRAKLELQAIWEKRVETQEALVQALQTWCKKSEASGIQALSDFSRELRRLSPAQPLVLAS